MEVPHLGPGARPPQAVDILQIILQQNNLEESKTVFVNLALQLVVLGVVWRREGSHLNPTNLLDLSLILATVRPRSRYILLTMTHPNTSSLLHPTTVLTYFFLSAAVVTVLLSLSMSRGRVVDSKLARRE